MTFGQRIRKLREENDLSREQLAKSLNLSYWAIAKYEAGERTPDSKTLQCLADFFQVSVDYLLGRTDDPSGIKHDHKTPLNNGSDLDKEWPEVANVLRRAGKKMTPADKRRIAKIIQAAIPAEDDDEKND